MKHLVWDAANAKRKVGMLNKIDIGFLAIGLLLIGIGGYYGLFVAPAEMFMGEVYRIMYVHVPSAWMTLVGYTMCFVCCLLYLFKSKPAFDHAAEAAAAVGVMFNTLLLISGSIWGKPTWGVWWAWDPRLTTAAIMFLAYGGYLLMRSFVDDPDRRAMWAAVVGILVFVNIPIVWFSVKWWNTLHQVQSSPKTVGPEMVIALRLNAFAFLSLFIFFVRLRYRLSKTLAAAELAPPPEA